MKASKQHIMNVFEEEFKSRPAFDLDFERTPDGESFENLVTCSVFGSFMIGYQAHEARDPNTAWLKTRGH